MSDVHEHSVCIQLSLLAVKQRPPDCKVSYDLVVVLSNDLTTFWANSSNSGSIIHEHHAFSRYTVFNISKRDFSIFIIMCVRPFWQIWSHMHNCFTCIGNVHTWITSHSTPGQLAILQMIHKRNSCTMK